MSDATPIDWRQVLSEPLDVKAVADLYDVTTRHVKTIVSGIPGVHRCGQRYMIPLGYLPASYLLDVGLIQSTEPDPVRGKRADTIHDNVMNYERGAGAGE